jgi:hypothetical protein
LGSPRAPLDETSLGLERRRLKFFLQGGMKGVPCTGVAGPKSGPTSQLPSRNIEAQVEQGLEKRADVCRITSHSGARLKNE